MQQTTSDVHRAPRRLRALHQLRRAGKRSAKRLAGALVPHSLLVFRGHTGSARRRLALTFDDGPDMMTPEYLAVLDALRVRATFFVIGKACERLPEMVQMIAEAGHELGVHGYTHKRFTELPAQELAEELRRTRSLLPLCPDHRPLVRPPHGSVSLSSMVTCAKAGFTTVLWSHDSGDARTDRKDVLVREFEHENLGRGEIVLLHEGQGWTLEALPEIVHRLREDGHALVTVGELLHD